MSDQFNPRGGRFSPDGRWVAYTSDESGKPEVYVQPFPAMDVKRLVSGGGGAGPRWRRDGKELFYVTPDRRLMAVPVSAGTVFDSGTPRALFQLQDMAASRIPYDVAADGQRFLVNLPLDDTGAAPPITVVLNWNAGLKKQ